MLHWEHLNKQHDMKNYKAYLLFLSLGLLMLSACERPDKDIVCNISGTAVGFSDLFVIIPIDGDPRQPLAKVEIQPDGSFSGSFEANTSVPYLAQIWNLAEGQGCDCTFFPEKNIVFSINGLAPPELASYSGRNNKEYRRFYRNMEKVIGPRQDSLDAAMSALEQNPSLRLSPEANELYVKANNPDTSDDERHACYEALGDLAQKGLAYSQEYKDVLEGMTQLGHDYHDYAINYIRPHRSLVSFCMLARECLVLYDYALSFPEDEYNYKTLSELFDIYETDFADRFPGHPFHDKIAQLQENATMLAGQSHYVDFSLPDADGVSHSLSELIDGKIAVLDLWASWCGGCRRHSKALIPLYDRYKDKGFTIVGVARELKDDLAWRAALEKDGYPWVNLLAMEPDHWVWSKYGVGNGGGGIFLIGRDGIVVAVNPTVEEIEEYFKKSLDK